MINGGAGKKKVEDENSLLRAHRHKKKQVYG